MSPPTDTTPMMSQPSNNTYGTSAQSYAPQPDDISSQSPESPMKHFGDPQGATLEVDFAWSKFRNIISEKSPSGELTPLYIQHFRPLKPQLRIDSITDPEAVKANPKDDSRNVPLSTGTINTFSINAECSINNRTIELKPLKRLITKYNYLSYALSSDPNTPTPVTWMTNSSLKIWDFVCLDANQNAIAKFSVNFWAIKEVGNFHFAKTAEHLSKEVRDEVVTVGLTLMYVMTTRINNPLNLVGSAFTKVGKVEPPEEMLVHDGTKVGAGKGDGSVIR